MITPGGESVLEGVAAGGCFAFGKGAQPHDSLTATQLILRPYTIIADEKIRTFIGCRIPLARPNNERQFSYPRYRA